MPASAVPNLAQRLDAQWADRGFGTMADTSEGRVANVELMLDGRPALADMPLERTFRSGSRGYYTTGKAIMDGKRYQIAVTMTEIHSKPGSVGQVPNGADTAGNRDNGPVVTRTRKA